MGIFKDFLTEKSIARDTQYENSDIPDVLHNHLWHLSSPMLGKPDTESTFVESEEYSLKASDIVITEAREDAKHPNEIVRNGISAEQSLVDSHKAAGTHPPSIRARIKAGFHSAMPAGETPDVTAKKAKESMEHFRGFMHTEGGHAKNNKLMLLSQNGKTASSAGAGRNTVGLALAPHSLGSVTSDGITPDGGKTKGHFDTCPSASSECRKNCLGVTAGGNRQYPENSLRAKVLRQRYVVEHPEHTARLLSKEIGENEHWCANNDSIHDKTGSIVGHIHKKTGKIDSSSKDLSKEVIGAKLKSGELERRPIESGVRLNVTSDLQHHNLHPASFFERHSASKFYDYTKNTGSIKDVMPHNYTIGLSHTGDNHAESNSSAVIKHLSQGGISAMVYKRGKDQPKPKRVKVVGSNEGEHEWEVVDGDSDDNLDQRHVAAAKIHLAHSEAATKSAAKETNPAQKAMHLQNAEKHAKIADEYMSRKRGIVSGLELKGVKNEAAGHFANTVDHTGTIWLHDKGTVAQLKKSIPIKAV